MTLKKFAVCTLLLVQSLYCAEIDIHGFVSQGYINTSHNNYLGKTIDGSFQFSETGLNFSTQVDEKLRIGAQFFARDLGELGNNEIEIDWAYGDYRLSDHLGFRIGKIKDPVGFYNTGRDVDMLRTTVILPQAVYTESYRSMASFNGLSSYGNLQFSEKIGDLDWNLFTGSVDMSDKTLPINYDNLYGMQALTALALANPALNPVSILDANTDTHAFRGYSFSWNTPLEGFRVGYSNLNTTLEQSGLLLLANGTVQPVAAYKMEVKKYETYSFEYTKDDWTFITERHNLEYLLNGKTQGTLGYYSQINKKLTEKWEIGLLRGKKYADMNNKNGQGMANPWVMWQEDTTLALRYDATENWIFKLEYHDIEGTGETRMPLNQALGINPVKDWDMILIKATYSF